MSRKIQFVLPILALALSALACNLPMLQPQAAATAAPTDAGFQIPTQPGDLPELTGEPPAGIETPPAEALPTGEAPVPGMQGDNRRVTLATTDSLSKSGLLDKLVNAFMASTGYEVRLELGGSGRAFRLAEKYVADVLLVNDVGEELAFIKSGNGRERFWVMHTDWVIAGPEDDPAGVKGAADAVEAFKMIADSGSTFVTRGIESPVVLRERSIWRKTGIEPSGAWYVAATDSGMPGTMKLAHDKKAYTLLDRVTFIENLSKFGNLVILHEGSEDLLDKYHVVTVNPEKSPKINDAGAQAFVQFLLSPEAQAMIAQQGADQYGQPVYFADAGKPED